jgi:hypothetical protein
MRLPLFCLQSKLMRSVVHSVSYNSDQGPTEAASNQRFFCNETWSKGAIVCNTKHTITMEELDKGQINV